MDYKELIKALKSTLPQRVPYGELVGAEGAFAHSGPMVYEDPEPYFVEQEITAITELLSRAEAAESEQETLQRAMAEYKARAEKAEMERDAAIKELNGVASTVDDLSDFIDEQIHPLVQYDMYLALRENADSISIWQYESEWSGQKEE